ncbi:unnamed protein product [Lactuca saligna]|uniref:Arabidopsis retrotransposon Orf1 C-terminal domain-containing protein n=1 Tax=Lactuca saligna TaxID=75948 RepID=A0AA36E1E0_LACSI|nr:unnamed protein product [Lactuca saligna]
MQELHIYDGVHALFANIGWERLLSVDFATCPLLTQEFLATLSEVNHEGSFSFHIFSTPHTIHVDQLCTFFHTPITSLSQPTPAFDVREFWYSITDLEFYDSTQSIQTSNVHTVLKIALKIICNIIYAHIETTKADKAELFLLWCMIIGSHCPHFGDTIIKSFHTVIALRTGGAIHYGGLIYVIAHSIMLQSPPWYTLFVGDSFRLTQQTLWAMHMLRTAPCRYVWMQGRFTYFNIPPPLRPRRAQQVRCPQSDRPSWSTQHPDCADATPISFS